MKPSRLRINPSPLTSIFVGVLATHPHERARAAWLDVSARRLQRRLGHYQEVVTNYGSGPGNVLPGGEARAGATATWALVRHLGYLLERGESYAAYRHPGESQGQRTIGRAARLRGSGTSKLAMKGEHLPICKFVKLTRVPYDSERGGNFPPVAQSHPGNVLLGADE